MCGIVGLLLGTPSEAAGLQAEVRAMAQVLAHRGPDDEGDWTDPAGRVALGFRRLSILDLSPTGHQPMISPSGRYVMVFNGEVYNFGSLRKRLAGEGVAFRGTSDSEVILAAFDRWDVEPTLAQMIGMFAIGLWDRDAEELVLIRDRMGIKPLYVARTRRGIAFASELGPLMRAPGFVGDLDHQAILTYLTYLYVPAPRTPFRSVLKLMPGHVLRIPIRSLSGPLPESRAFWSVEDARARGGESGDGASPVDRLEDLLSDAVRLRMVADVPVGALLSGGLDSSLVVALMGRHSDRPVRTFTIGFDQPEHDESAHARAVARHLGTDHTELMLSDRDALDLVPTLPTIFDEPLADPSQIPTYLVSRLARQQVTVALSGDGGDELFAGYNRYLSGQRLAARFARTPPFLRRSLASVLRAVPAAAWGRVGALGGSRLRLLDAKAYKVQRMLRAGSSAEMYRSLLCTADDASRFLPGVPPDWDPVRAGLPSGRARVSLGDMLLVDQQVYLPDDLLQKVDRASMATSLEVRVPLLDHRVVEYSWTLADEYKIRGKEGKWLLRQVLYRHVPRALVDRPKTGFSVPVEAWLRGALRDWAEHQLLGVAPGRDPVFDRGAVRAAWSGFLGGRNQDALGLWAMVMFEAWRDRWSIDEGMDSVGSAVAGAGAPGI